MTVAAALAAYRAACATDDAELLAFAADAFNEAVERAVDALRGAGHL